MIQADPMHPSLVSTNDNILQNNTIKIQNNSIITRIPPIAFIQHLPGYLGLLPASPVPCLGYDTE